MRSLTTFPVLERRGRLEEQDVHLAALGARPVLHAPGDHDQLTGPQPGLAIAEFHAQAAAQHEESRAPTLKRSG